MTASQHSNPGGTQDVSTYPSITALADVVAQSRPSGDPSLEQFLMEPNSVAAEARKLVQRYAGRRVLFLGDDDHVSIVCAAFSDIEAIVIEVDQRVVDNLAAWRDRLRLINLSVHRADIRDPPKLATLCDAFYLNPPYSSKNKGHGLKAWIDVATRLCTDFCDGVVLMPANRELEWVNDNWLQVQDYITANGFRIMQVDNDLQAYERVNDLGLRSQELVLARVRPQRRLPEPPESGEGLYR